MQYSANEVSGNSKRNYSTFQYNSYRKHDVAFVRF